jgi:hypothetical protein
MPLVFATSEPAAPSPDAGAHADEDEVPIEHPALDVDYGRGAALER